MSITQVESPNFLRIRLHDLKSPEEHKVMVCAMEAYRRYRALELSDEEAFRIACNGEDYDSIGAEYYHYFEGIGTYQETKEFEGKHYDKLPPALASIDAYREHKKHYPTPSSSKSFI